MVLSRKEKNAYWMPYTDNRWFKGNPKLLERAKGMYYTTSKGEKILDGVAGLWCVNAGHCRSKIVDAVQEQVAKMDYGLSFQMGHKLAFEFAERLVNILPDGNHFDVGMSTYPTFQRRNSGLRDTGALKKSL